MLRRSQTPTLAIPDILQAYAVYNPGDLQTRSPADFLPTRT